jgi:hypothetical protein
VALTPGTRLGPYEILSALAAWERSTGHAIRGSIALWQSKSFLKRSLPIRSSASVSIVTGAREVWVQPFPATGAKWQVSTEGGSEPQWRDDGRELFYVAGDGVVAGFNSRNTMNNHHLAAHSPA